MTLVFVYGTLKRGNFNNRILAGAAFIGKAKTAPIYRMLSNGAFPYLIHAGNGIPCHGEIYEVDDETLARLDQLEGVPYHYVRKTIVINGTDMAGLGIATRNVNAYLLERPLVTPLPEIESGNWDLWAPGDD